MKLEVMEADRALEQGMALPWALVRSLSQVTLGPAPREVDPAELLEARFFSAGEEIRVFREGDGLRAVRLTPQAGEAVLEEPRKIANPIFGTAVTVCRALAFDEDGQAYVSGERLIGWEGGAAYGQ